MILAIAQKVDLYSVDYCTVVTVSLRSRLVTQSPPGRTAHRPAIFFPAHPTFFVLTTTISIQESFYGDFDSAHHEDNVERCEFLLAIICINLDGESW